MLKVLVSGACGKMGREVCKAILSDPEVKLTGAVDVVAKGADIGEIVQLQPLNILIRDNLKEALKKSDAEIMVDFTHPDAVMNNIITALESGVHVVVGTTGIDEKDLKRIAELCKTYRANAVIAPNFAIGAVLMMKMAKIASKVMDDVEIIELHHPEKADSPSGTAMKTAEIIGENMNSNPKTGKEAVENVRGGCYKKVRIHSVRLPGLVAHQKVIFGGKGQTLTISHDSIDRSSFMPGVMLSIKKVKEIKGLTYGLESILSI